MKTHILAGVPALLFVGRAFAPVPMLTKGERPGRDMPAMHHSSMQDSRQSVSQANMLSKDQQQGNKEQSYI